MCNDMELNERLPPTPRMIPAAQPSAASRRLSVSNWRMSRPRVAPRAARMVTSRWRAAARTRQRLAMFIQARTRMEAARIRNNALARASMRGPAGPSDMLTGPSWMARSVSQASAFAFCRVRRCETTCMAESACRRLASGFNRATSVNLGSRAVRKSFDASPSTAAIPTGR